MKRQLCVLILFCFCLFIATQAGAVEVPAAEIVLVANVDVPGTTLDVGSVEKVFLGKTSSVGNKKIEVTTLKGGDVHDAFLKNYIKKTANQFKNSWKKLVFSGKAKMPKEFATEKEMVAYIAKTSGAIGYVHVKTSTDDSIMSDKVKVLTIKK